MLRSDVDASKAGRPSRRFFRRLPLAVATSHLVAAALLVPAAAPVQAAAPPPPPVVGIHDSSINGCDSSGMNANQPNYPAALAALNSRYWPGLHVATARVIVPWDIAAPHAAYSHQMSRARRAHKLKREASIKRSERAVSVEGLCLNEWLSGMNKHGVTPEVAFNPDHNYLTPNGKHIAIPSLRTYTAAMGAFTRRYTACSHTCALPKVGAGFERYPAGTGRMARVRIVAPWNEPNFSSDARDGFAQKRDVFEMPGGSSTFSDPNCKGSATAATCGPVLAARMWRTVSRLCVRCTVIAGDFTSSGGLESRGDSTSYLSTYAHHLGRRKPQVWSVHPYLDTSNFEWAVKTHQPKPQLSHTVTGRFASALQNLGYDSSTSIVLDEVSAFRIDMYNHGRRHDPRYSPRLQARATKYLMSELAQAGGATTEGQPMITGMYYLRFADTGKFPNWALVVGGKRQKAYYVVAHRPRTKGGSVINQLTG